MPINYRKQFWKDLENSRWARKHQAYMDEILFEILSGKPPRPLDKDKIDLKTACRVKKLKLSTLSKKTGILLTKITLIDSGYPVANSTEREKIAKALCMEPDDINWPSSYKPNSTYWWKKRTRRAHLRSDDKE